MKISTQSQSRFLTHDEVRTPLMVTMDHVTEDRTLRNPFVLHFAPAHRLKPFPMNVTNRRIIVAAYGDDDGRWHGQQIELYYNSSIPNPRNAAQPGGICVRIPTGPASNGPGSNGTGARSATPPASPKPKPPPPAAPKPATPRPAAIAPNGTASTTKTPALAAEKTQAFEGIRRANTAENLERWRRWAESLAFDSAARAELSRAHTAAKERIAAARRPTTARA